MALRNYWIEVDIDGQKTRLAGGPRARDGKMEIRLYVRDHNASENAVKINCVPDGETLYIKTKIGGDEFTYQSIR